MSRKTEYYDPDKPVCDNQPDFNIALREAIHNNAKENLRTDLPWMYVYTVIWMVFFIWALILAMKVANGQERVIHIVFAISFAPVYVLSYYLGKLTKKKKEKGSPL